MALKRVGASGIFPLFEKPEALTVLDVRPYSWEEQLTAACLQGLVNRDAPTLYVLAPARPPTRFWPPVTNVTKYLCQM